MILLPAQRRCAWLSVVFVLLAVGACAEVEYRPYDEKADAKAAIAQLLADTASQKRILLTFGANWCEDSRALESHYRDPELAALLQREFRVLHVDVGVSHRNLDINQRYGNPIDKGIPSVVLLRPDGTVLYTAHGKLSSAHRMSHKKVMTFFTRLAADGHVD